MTFSNICNQHPSPYKVKMSPSFPGTKTSLGSDILSLRLWQGNSNSTTQENLCRLFFPMRENSHFAINEQQPDEIKQVAIIFNWLMLALINRLLKFECGEGATSQDCRLPTLSPSEINSSTKSISSYTTS